MALKCLPRWCFIKSPDTRAQKNAVRCFVMFYNHNTSRACALIKMHYSIRASCLHSSPTCCRSNLKHLSISTLSGRCSSLSRRLVYTPSIVETRENSLGCSMICWFAFRTNSLSVRVINTFCVCVHGRMCIQIYAISDDRSPQKAFIWTLFSLPLHPPRLRMIQSRNPAEIKYSRGAV